MQQTGQKVVPVELAQKHATNGYVAGACKPALTRNRTAFVVCLDASIWVGNDALASSPYRSIPVPGPASAASQRFRR